MENNSNRVLATKTLLRALMPKKETLVPPPTMRSEREEVSPFTLREGLFHEPKTMPGFARMRAKSYPAL
ncbi:MAG: hypothetical protein U0270_06560 [Labilithrix sp.]